VTDNTSAARFVGIALEKNGQAAAIANVPKENWDISGVSAKDLGR
jgi:hypothetical protein